uniref:Uncharacterized protein n=1 Tax=Anguilla anguilla TaxID=7936 RepID=A0A0E9UNC9_ANGAN
MKTTKNDN